MRQGRGVLNWRSRGIIERARKPDLSREDRLEVLYHLALDKMDHGFDKETFDVLSKALKDPDSYVRASALLGSAYLAWPQLADPVRPLATNAEPDEGIRKDAALLLPRLEASTATSN